MTARLSLAKRISPRDLQDYLQRRLSCADIARMYGTQPKYVSEALPKRPYSNRLAYKRQLRATRKEFRDNLAKQVDAGTMTVKEAAAQAFCSERTIFRHLQAVRQK